MYKQGASLVDAALESGDLFKGDGFAHVKQAFEGHTLHLIGLLSNGGVHARYEQLKQLFQGAYEHGAKRIRLHILTDGRDVPDGSSIEFVGQLEKDLEQLRAKGETGGGRSHDAIALLRGKLTPLPPVPLPCPPPPSLSSAPPSKKKKRLRRADRVRRWQDARDHGQVRGGLGDR